MINKEFESNNYIVIKNFLDKYRAEDLAKNFISDALVFKFQGDSQCPRSMSKYNYKYFVHLLCEKVFHVSNLYGNPVLPTYSYARYYKDGGSLENHTDRPSCEISVTLNLQKDRDWPIHIQSPSGSISSVELDQGDAMMYRGCIAPHWRDPIDSGNLVQVFLHYVDLNGPNKNHYFDRLNGDILSGSEASL